MCVCVLLLLLFWEDSGTRAFYLLFCFVVCYCLCCGQRARSPFAAQPDAALHLHLSTPKEGLPKWLSGKESTCQCRRHGFDPWVRKIPWSRKWQPTPVFLPGEFHEQRNLVGYSPWGRTEMDTTVRLSTLTLSTHPMGFSFLRTCSLLPIICYSAHQACLWWAKTPIT